MKSKIIFFLLGIIAILLMFNVKTNALTLPWFSISSVNYSVGDKMNLKENYELKIEESLQLYGFIIYENDFDPEYPDNLGTYIYEKDLNGVIWESDDTNVATVDDNGKVTGISEGETTIRATYNGESSNYEINVKSKDYASLKQMMQEAIDSKDFSDLANQYLMEIFENLYENYPSYQKVYKDLPDVEIYIKNNLIDVIEYINSISLYKYGTPEADAISQIGDGYAEEMDITLIYGKYETDEEHLNDIERLFHEINHVKQEANNIDGFYSIIIIEGEATFNEQFVQKNSPRHSGGCTISADGKNIWYNKTTYAGNSYAMYLYGYEFLEYVLGYDIMSDVSNGNIGSEDLIELLYEKTRINLWDLVELDNWSDNPSQSYNYAKEVENTFLSSIKNDISKLDTNNKKLVKKYINIYRDHKYRVMPSFYRTEFYGNWEDDLSYQELNLLEVDNALIDKIMESGIMSKFSDNDNLNRMAIRSILKADRCNYYKNDDVYQSMQLPICMDNAQYSYFEQDGQGHLILKYENPYDEDIWNLDTGEFTHQHIENKEFYLEYIFDESNIISVKEPSEELKAELDDFKSIYIPMRAISIKQLPTRTNYCKDERLNTEGLAITVEYDNGDTEDITEGFECTPTDLNKVGQQTITVSYNGKETTFDVEVAAEHNWNEGNITKAPTCTEKGIRTYTCTVCHQTKTEDIEEVEHTWNEGNITKAPTCTEKGTKTYTCTVCNATKTEEIEALGHNYENGSCTRCMESIFANESKYKITNKAISGIKPNTAIDDFTNNMRNEFNVIVTKNEEEVTEGLIGTGMKVKIYENSKLIADYIAIVSGDLNGNGELTVTDLLMLKRYIVQLEQPNGYQGMAADLNDDDRISVTDLLMVKRKIVGLE